MANRTHSSRLYSFSPSRTLIDPLPSLGLPQTSLPLPHYSSISYELEAHVDAHYRSEKHRTRCRSEMKDITCSFRPSF